MPDNKTIEQLVSENFRNFVREHAHDDVCRLRLKYGSDEAAAFAIDQIEARQKTGRKLPTWAENESLLFPSPLSAEQASSEETARCKQRLFGGRFDTICDLTGGLGVDTLYFSQTAENVSYIERFPRYCEVARHNFDRLGCRNITVVCADCREYLQAPHPHHALYYIDPARRGEGNRRVFGLADCEPDIAEVWQRVAAEGARLLVKASPMLDISQTLREYAATDVYVLSVKNECKELLFLLSPACSDEAVIHCINLADGREQTYSFTPAGEAALPTPVPPAALGAYLYEPNASILKAGAYKSACRDFGVSKLSASSHLYTSEKLVSDFQGRIFEIVETLPFSRQTLKTCAARYPQANLTCRNFPLSADELRRQAKIKEGGETYIFATTWKNDKILIVCLKAYVC